MPLRVLYVRALSASLFFDHRVGAVIFPAEAGQIIRIFSSPFRRRPRRTASRVPHDSSDHYQFWRRAQSTKHSASHYYRRLCRPAYALNRIRPCSRSNGGKLVPPRLLVHWVPSRLFRPGRCAAVDRTRHTSHTDLLRSPCDHCDCILRSLNGGASGRLSRRPMPRGVLFRGNAEATAHNPVRSLRLPPSGVFGDQRLQGLQKTRRTGCTLPRKHGGTRELVEAKSAFDHPTHQPLLTPGLPGIKRSRPVCSDRWCVWPQARMPSPVRSPLSKTQRPAS